nr:MAG TPA: hypothetical protein [Caudoviricetes sp.]
MDTQVGKYHVFFPRKKPPTVRQHDERWSK